MLENASLTSSPSISILSLLLNSELIRWLSAEVLQIWRERRFEGTYRVTEHSSTLELCDHQGKRSVYTKKQKVTFTQSGVFAIQDQAWGDGDIFAGYVCFPGVMVDKYKEGYRWKILISLRSTKNKNDQEEFLIERTVRGGYLTPICNFQVQVDHPTEVFTLSVIFPRKRKPVSVTLIEQNLKRHHPLDRSSCHHLSQGRVEYRWQTTKPRLFESYILRWEW